MNRSRLWQYVDVILLVAVAATLWRVSTGSLARNSLDLEGDRTLVPLVSTGQRSSLPIDWSESARHVVLRMSTACPTSQASVPFFRDVSRDTRSRSDVRFTVVSDEPRQVTDDWLRTNDIAIDEVLELEMPVRYGFLVLPTLLMLDNAGRVTDIVTDVSSAMTRERFVDRIVDSTHPPVDDTDYPEEIDEDDLHVRAKNKAVIVDVRDRSSGRTPGPGIASIPVDELSVRLRHEYTPRQPFVIDCRDNSALTCRLAARTFQNNGFPNVAIAFNRRPSGR